MLRITFSSFPCRPISFTNTINTDYNKIKHHRSIWPQRSLNEALSLKMKFHLPTQLSSETASALALLLFFYCLLRWKKSRHTRSKPPEPDGSWPIIGHLHLLRGLPHITLGNLADKYGPVYMLNLGVNKALVVSTPELAKECLGSNDKVFVDRPRTIFVKHLGFNSAMMGFSPYGAYWREIRKISTVELLSNQRLEMLRHVWVSEIRSAMKVTYNNYCVEKKLDGGFCREPLNMKEWFNDLNLNTSVRLIVGKSLKDSYEGEDYKRCKKVLMDFFELAGVFVPADALPWLRWLDIGGHEKAMKKAAKEIDRVAQGWLEEHKRRRVAGKATEKQDFMDVLLDKFETEQDSPFEFEADMIVKATCMAMILGGVNTVTVTLTWAVSLLLNNQDALKKVQDELDNIVGKERQVNETDLKNLVYLQAVIKETMRLYPAAPLSVPREAVSDCTISDYHIPARTRLFINLYKIQRDPEIWEDPLKFSPERFLTTNKDYDVRGQSFGYLPFGSGKRICPGISLALQVMQFILSNLLHQFDLSTPAQEAVDMTEGLGLTIHKTSPLKVIITPRLPDVLYGSSKFIVD
ncbi:hypothetical protein RND81_01G154000 [Saponaria officinalis]|uniref:Cytochrome P450 n=1 Tax=Saponaria officinalis TaxID=3572 RepID=A0AAW1NIY5_SAPOF